MNVVMFVADVPQAEQVPNLVIVSPEFPSRVWDQLLTSDIELAVKTAVRAEVLAVPHPHDGDRVVAICLRRNLFQLETAIEIAPVRRPGIGPVQTAVSMWSLEPKHAVPEALCARDQLPGVAFELARRPALDLLFRRVRGRVVGIAVHSGPASRRIDLRKEHANINRQVGVGVAVAHILVKRGVPFSSVALFGPTANQRAIFEIEFCHGDPPPELLWIHRSQVIVIKVFWDASRKMHRLIAICQLLFADGYCGCGESCPGVVAGAGSAGMVVRPGSALCETGLGVVELTEDACELSGPVVIALSGFSR